MEGENLPLWVVLWHLHMTPTQNKSSSKNTLTLKAREWLGKDACYRSMQTRVCILSICIKSQPWSQIHLEPQCYGRWAQKHLWVLLAASLTPNSMRDPDSREYGREQWSRAAVLLWSVHVGHKPVRLTQPRTARSHPKSNSELLDHRSPLLETNNGQTTANELITIQVPNNQHSQFPSEDNQQLMMTIKHQLSKHGGKWL